MHEMKRIVLHYPDSRPAISCRYTFIASSVRAHVTQEKKMMCI